MSDKVDEIIGKITAAIGPSEYFGGDMLTALMVMAGTLAREGISQQGIEFAKTMLPEAIQLFLEAAGASADVSLLDRDLLQ